MALSHRPPQSVRTATRAAWLLLALALLLAAAAGLSWRRKAEDTAAITAGAVLALPEPPAGEPLEPPARRYFQSVIEALAARGCDAVVLGCTEIPLLIAPEDSVLPVLDSTRILARAALRAAVSRL